MSQALMPIGSVVRAHGVRGVVRVRPYDAASEAFATVARVFVGEAAEERRVVHASRDKQDWLVTLEGVAGREAAEALRGAVLHALRDELPPPGEGEVFVADLVGCEVFDGAGARVGAVLRVDNYGAHDLLVVDRGGGREALIPFVEEMVTAVDVEARRIECELPEGLLDLDEGGK